MYAPDAFWDLFIVWNYPNEQITASRMANATSALHFRPGPHGVFEIFEVKSAASFATESIKICCLVSKTFSKMLVKTYGYDLWKFIGKIGRNLYKKGSDAS